MLNGHGDDLHNYGRILYNFSSNVYYEGCSPDLIQILEKALVKSVNNYPSPSAEELSLFASEYYKLDPEYFLFFNGATEAFYTIGNLFKNLTATIFAPTFAEYQGACEVHDIKIQWKSKEAFNQPIDTALAFVCNPNNPDGTIVSIKDIEDFLVRNKKTTLIVDEAYIEFTNAVKSVIHLCEAYENLIVVRSLTKVFAIPGIRLGYVGSNPKLIVRLISKKMPWSVNSIAIKAGESIFKNYDRWHFATERLMAEMQEFVNELSTIDWLEVRPTNTTYVLIQLNKGNAADLKQYLAKEHQILIRDATNFTKLKGECIRLSLQRNDVNAILINALKQW